MQFQSPESKAFNKKEDKKQELNNAKNTFNIPFNLLTPNNSNNNEQSNMKNKSNTKGESNYKDSKSQRIQKSDYQNSINDDIKSQIQPYREVTSKGQSNTKEQIIKHKDPLKHNKQDLMKLQQYAQESQKQIFDKETKQPIPQNQLVRKQTKQYSSEEIDYHIGYIQNMWQYRYTRYLEDAVFNKNWMKLFSFLGQFKEKCINILKSLVNSNLKKYKCLEEIDYRYNMKNQGQDGIYMIDGIIIRIAKMKESSISEFNDVAIKGLHQEYLAYNILNNLCISLLKTDFQRVRVPLTALVKYHGFTALCQADTPCQGLQTLIHGPTATIYQYRQESMPILRAIGEQLNLKQFKMMSKDGKTLSIPFSLTVELHKVTRQLKNQNVISWIDSKSVLYPPNGKPIFQKPQYYLLNVRKLWPLFIDSDIVKSSGHLRPQVVLSWKTKLSNTVFSRVSYKEHPNSQLQLADACKTLKQDNVKILARMLDNTTIFLIDSQGIQQIMHQYGVNMRFMGELAKKVTLDFSRKVLETQMIARTCKKYFFTIFDDLPMQKRQQKDIIPYLKQNFVDFLNLIFIRNQDGQRFYRKYVYERIQSYYEYQIKEYPPNIPGGGLLHAIAYHFGIKVKVIDYPFFQAGVDSIFNISHITDIVGFAKVFDMQTSQIKLLCRKFKDKRKKNMIDECISELKILAAINKNLNHQKTNNIGSYRQSFFYAQLAQIYFAKKDYQIARTYAQLSLKSIPQKHADSIKPFGVLIKYYSVKKEINRCIQYYQKSLSYLGYHLSPDHPLTISVYNTLGYEFVSSMDPAKCEKIFMKSFEICQQALGYMHHTSSQILMQLAGLPLPPEKTINFLLQALTILQNLGDHHQHIQQVSMKISEMYNKLGNIQKMIYFARKSNHWKMQVIGQDKLNHDRTVFQLTNREPANLQQVKFLVNYAVKSYLRNLQRVPKDNLYKLFVNIQQNIVNQKQAAKYLMKRLTEDRSSINTVADFVKNNFVILIRQIPRMLMKHHFYTTKLQDRDKYMKVWIQTFINIMSLIGIQDVQAMFMNYKRTF